jgi:hypothetical protein
MRGGELAHIRSDQLDKAFMDILYAYKDATDESVKAAIEIVGKECVDDLKNAHPAGSGQYGSWDDYNSTWTVTKTKRDKREHHEATVHNTKHYQLTHLLEKGHALPQGGRARAFKHIEPVANKAEVSLLKTIKEKI